MRLAPGARGIAVPVLKAEERLPLPSRLKEAWELWALAMGVSLLVIYLALASVAATLLIRDFMREELQVSGVKVISSEESGRGEMALSLKCPGDLPCSRTRAVVDLSSSVLEIAAISVNGVGREDFIHSQTSSRGTRVELPEVGGGYVVVGYECVVGSVVRAEVELTSGSMRSETREIQGECH